MKPTAKLRFIERPVPMHPFYKTVDALGNITQVAQTTLVLQQWWEDQWLESVGEWRDIPLEKEQ